MTIAQILLRPVPDYTDARKRKNGYRDYPVNTTGKYSGEPLVDIAEYGLAGQSHYSRPTAATGKPLPGAEPRIWLRQSVVERLADINMALQESTEAEAIFGAKAELFLEEGYRPLAVQRQLYKEVFPALIRKQNPEMGKAEIMARRDQLIAKPSMDSSSPSPHATGGVFDICIRRVNPDMRHIADAKIDMNGGHQSTSEVTNPDYFEHNKPLSANERQAQKNRRAFYWIMRGALTGEITGFSVNPTEWWHWSCGDQLWGAVTEAPAAFYGAAPDPATSR
ncbi:MAG TPA: M15 family metallopeptidase [Candidatus Saccharimonadales bacterium]|nr:M15 family metallopeptidase [Candidatus Saccharimonadales bacterium]